MEKWVSQSERLQINVFAPAFCRQKGWGSSLETTTKPTYFMDQPWAKTSAYTGEQQLCLWHKGCLSVPDFTITENSVVQLCCPFGIGSVTSAGVWGTPQLWGQARKPRVHQGCLQGGIRIWINQQWMNFLPKLKVAGGPLCLSAMEGLKHSKNFNFKILFPFESLTEYLFAIGFSLLA